MQTPVLLHLAHYAAIVEHLVQVLSLIYSFALQELTHFTHLLTLSAGI